MPAENTGVRMLLALLLVGVTSTGLASVRYGAPPPDFHFSTPRGALADLTQLHGRPVVINFWASWCGPCTDELPYFQRLVDRYGDRVVLITVSNQAPGVARQYLAEHHYDLPVLEDPDGSIFKAYSITPIPDTVVLGANGEVQYVSVGGLSWDELHGAVDHALDQAVERPAPGNRP